MKRLFSLLCLLCLLLSLCACSSQSTSPASTPVITTVSPSQTEAIVNSDSSEITTSPNTEITTTTVPVESIEVPPDTTMPQDDPTSDTAIGLRNIKIDSEEQDLTEDQKTVLQYFDGDYLNVPDYEFLRRYPNIFAGAQIYVWGSIEKVISMDQAHYEALFWVNVGTYDRNEGGLEDRRGDYIIIEGETGDNWYMERDQLAIYGRYGGIETVEVDGTSYTIPRVTVFRSFLDQSEAPSWVYHYIPKFDDKFVKKTAKIIFGEDIEVRKLDENVDVPPEMMGLFDPESYLVVEPENQSNAKFKKFRFSKEMGEIVVADDVSSSMSMDRYIEFAADFQHFFMLSHNRGLDSLTLEYYDSQLDKLWKREFEDAYYNFTDFYSSGVYDYTKTNVYLIVNNELYTINAETGEDAKPPVYVGDKIAIRKLTDGILLISDQKADGVMKYDLEGNIQWKTKLPTDLSTLEGIQFVDGRIILQAYYWESANNFGTHYLVFDAQTGEMTADAISYSS